MDKPKEVDIRIIQQPIEVRFECPECEEDIEISFSDFEDMAGEYCNWEYTEIECPGCTKKLKINYVDWD
jgi:hypothetical protein